MTNVSNSVLFARFAANPPADLSEIEKAQDELSFLLPTSYVEFLLTANGGEPYPLEQQIVDISENPGRWEFHQGYIEAIGPLMWLGDNFWRVIAHNNEDALAKLPWLHLTKPREGILQLSSSIYFQDETTAPEQNALRAAIYGS